MHLKTQISRYSIGSNCCSIKSSWRRPNYALLAAQQAATPASPEMLLEFRASARVRRHPLVGLYSSNSSIASSLSYAAVATPCKASLSQQRLQSSNPHATTLFQLACYAPHQPHLAPCVQKRQPQRALKTPSFASQAAVRCEIFTSASHQRRINTYTTLYNYHLPYLSFLLLLTIGHPPSTISPPSLPLTLHLSHLLYSTPTSVCYPLSRPIARQPISRRQIPPAILCDPPPHMLAFALQRHCCRAQ